MKTPDAYSNPITGPGGIPTGGKVLKGLQTDLAVPVSGFPGVESVAVAAVVPDR
jgi:hypothetical protein